MAAKGSSYAAALLRLVFNNTTLAGIGDATGLVGSTVAGSLYVSLHTATPIGGSQSTSECSYSGYVRIALARNSGVWIVSGASVSPAAAISFAPASIGDLGTTVTHVGIGTASSGSGILLYCGSISPTVSLGAGVIPIVGTGTNVAES